MIDPVLMLHDADRTFQPRTTPKTPGNQVASSCSSTTPNNQSGGSSSVSLVTDRKGLIQIMEVEVHTGTDSPKFFAWCESAGRHFWIFRHFVPKLIVKGLPTQITVHGLNLQQVVDTEIVELKLTPVHSGGSYSAFDATPSVRKRLHVGNDVIDVDYLKTPYPRLEPIFLKKIQVRGCRNDTGSKRVPFNPPIGVF